MASYRYDAAGNRTDSGAALQPNSNRYATFNGFTMEYDAEGNLTRKYKAGFDQRLAWNSLGRLTSVTTNGVIVSYGYAASGRRVRRTAGGVSAYFLYDDDDLILEIDSAGNPIRAYTHLPGIDLPLSVRTTSGGQELTHYYTLEAPGHVTGVLSTTGSVAGQYRYGPFGEVESQNDTTGQPLRYMARELDSATGLYYVRNRWYDPSLARFASEDPAGLAAGVNTYAYVGNDPMNRRDPSGLGWGYCVNDPRVPGRLLCIYYASPWEVNPGTPWGEPPGILKFGNEAYFNGITPGWWPRATDLTTDAPVQEPAPPVDCFVPAPEGELPRSEYLIIDYATVDRKPWSPCVTQF